MEINALLEEKDQNNLKQLKIYKRKRLLSNKKILKHKDDSPNAFLRKICLNL